MKNRLFSALATLFALMLGLFLPFLTAAVQDAALSAQLLLLKDNNAHYAYQGTLMNRVVALNACLTGSTAVSRSAESAASAPAGLLSSLSGFLPVSSASAESACAFSLYPKQYSAEYRYLIIRYAMDGGSLTVITDCETGLPLRMELTCPGELFSSWLSGYTAWDILSLYAAHLDLGQPTDDECTISSVMHSQSAQLRGTAYKATVMIIPSAGTLLLKLTASTPA